MSPLLMEFFLPLVRFAGHSIATALGFIVLVLVTLAPVYVVKGIAWLGLVELADQLRWLEKGILYLDIFPYLVVLLFGRLSFLLKNGVPCGKH